MLFETYEQLKEQYAIGKLKPKEDEYLGENGLPFCKKCNTPRHWISDDRKAAAHCVCKCQQEEIRRKQEEEARQKRIDEFNNRSKLSLIYPYQEKSVHSTIDFMKRAFTYFGYLPAIVQTDNGTEFTTPKVAKKTTVCAVDTFLAKLGIKHKLIKPFTPRHNGKVERSHRSDQESFYNYLTYSTYDELKEKMREWLDRYNNRPHSSLKNREGKRVWLTPLEKRAELLEDYRKSGFRDDTDTEFRIRFIKKAA